MCGIAGLFDLARGQPGGALEHAVRAMTDTLVHRGPDGSGVFADETGGVALGHRRLSILDLSEAGAQPMASSDGRYVITFNGEIFNFADIARELPGGGTARRCRSTPRPTRRGHWKVSPHASSTEKSWWCPE